MRSPSVFNRTPTGILYVHDLLPGLELALNPALRLATLFYQGGEHPHMWQVQFSEHAMRVLMCIALAFPDYCPYEDLVACLYPQQVISLPIDDEMVMKPVYRAANQIMKELPQLGLTIDTVRGRGYRIVPARAGSALAVDSSHGLRRLRANVE